MTHRTFIPLKTDPYSVFRKSKTPPGLYARRKWLGQGEDRAWQRDFKEQTERLFEDQTPDGSWGGSITETVRRLFGLHLTVRTPNAAIEKALDWLITKALGTPGPRRQTGGGSLSRRELLGLPFTPGSSASFALAATLFLAAIFEKSQDPRIMKGYALLDERMFRKGMRRCGWAGFSNYLRALVVHPEYKKRRITRQAVMALAGVQTPDGRWPGGIPFYQTVNALAHLDVKEARDQLTPAFERLARTQNPDGSWGGSHKEWQTFLVVHALRNKGLL